MVKLVHVCLFFLSFSDVRHHAVKVARVVKLVHVCLFFLSFSDVRHYAVKVARAVKLVHICFFCHFLMSGTKR